MRIILQEKQPKTKEYFIELIQNLIKETKKADEIQFYMFCDDYFQLEKLWNDIPEFVNNKYYLECETNCVLLVFPPKYKVILTKTKPNKIQQIYGI